MTILKTAIALFAAAVLLAAPHASASEKRPIMYNITSDDAWTAGMALAQANTAAQRGHHVTVFLNVRGVHVADRDAAQSTFGPNGKTPAQMLASLIESEQDVLVCGVCMRAGGMTEDDLIDGARVSNPDLTFGVLNDPTVVVMSY
jgi:predicted peroxiredoxin